MEEVVVFDVAVVGGGIMGSCTGYHLVKSGAKTAILEQFSVGHKEGSSTGFSRVTRTAYSEQYYVEMMKESHEMWRSIEREIGQKIYISTGILVFGKEGSSSELESVISCLKRSGVSHEVFTNCEAKKRYPSLCLPEDFTCVMERDGGLILADKALAGIQDLFRKGGGTLFDNHEVLGIDPGSTTVTINTNKGKIYAKKVVLVPGSWAGKVLGQLGIHNLPLQIIRNEVYYWKTSIPEAFSSSNFPIIWYTPPLSQDTKFVVYGIPSHEYQDLVKICMSNGIYIDTPEDRYKSENSKLISVKQVSEFVNKFMNGVSSTPSIHDTCLYTITPDSNPIIDRHPSHPNIVFAIGFSGHGFKLGPVMGKLLCQLTLDRPLSFDLSPFKLIRFDSS